jgi:hypothetical protein
MADRISPKVLSVATRLATRVSFAEAQEVTGWFLPAAPSTEVIEAAVLGYGATTQEWFEQAPAPKDDGEILLIQLDSKGVPTATDEELRRRRGKRSGHPKAPSPRHRGRQARGRRTKKPRRAKGDKAKNAKMGTMAVMYTLRRQPHGDSSFRQRPEGSHKIRKLLKDDGEIGADIHRPWTLSKPFDTKDHQVELGEQPTY